MGKIALATSASLVPGASAHSVLTDWRRSPAHTHKSPGRAGARPSHGDPFGRHAPRAARVPRTPPHLPFRSEIPQFTFVNEISLRNKVSTSYLCHNSRISEDKSHYSSYGKIDPIHQPSTECAISRRNGSDVKSRTFRKMWRECGNTDGI